VACAYYVAWSWGLSRVDCLHVGRFTASIPKYIYIAKFVLYMHEHNRQTREKEVKATVLRMRDLIIFPTVDFSYVL
jgi:hypothetical protein